MSPILVPPIWQFSQQSPVLSAFGADENGGRRWHFALASRQQLLTRLTRQ